MRPNLSNSICRFLDKWRTRAAALWPAHCLYCGDQAPPRAVCEACWQSLPWLEGPVCSQCAHPLPAPGLCGRCLADPPQYDRVVAACRYAHPVDGLILACKYGGRLSAIRALAATLRRSTPTQGDLLLPMPLSAQRLRERGFNQALELARAAGRDAMPPLRADVSIKLRDTAAQTRLPWQERRRNIRGAFVTLERLDGLHVIVVDDVLTTGETLNDLARTLKKAGAATVTGWVVARTVARR